MYDLTDTQADTFKELSRTDDLKDFVTALERQAARLKDLVTNSWPVHHVDPPAIGSFLLYAQDAWEGTFDRVLRVAFEASFDVPDLTTLVVWTRNADPETKGTLPYVKTVGQAGDDVLGESDGNAVVRFYDGRVVDLDDIVAVSF